jgi:hypothetical protein
MGAKMPTDHKDVYHAEQQQLLSILRPGITEE